MKIAVLSDIHANLPAFQAVLSHLDSVEPHHVLVGGDIINRGPQPRECLELVVDRIKHQDWKVLKGNHEDYVLSASRGTDYLPKWEQQLCCHSAWTARAISEYLPVISSWPDSMELQMPDGSHLTCFHASKKGNRVGLYEFMQDHEILAHVHPVHSAICVGHTHVPFIRFIDGKLIGKTPLPEIPAVALGKHTIRVSAPGYRAFEQSAEVRFQKTTRIAALLAPTLPAPLPRDVKPLPAKHAWYTSTWFWIGSSVVFAAIGTYVGYRLAQERTVDCSASSLPAACM